MSTIISISATILIIYMFFKYRQEIKDTYKKLTIAQSIGVVFSYLIAIFIVFVLIYYVGNWLVGYITFEPFNVAMKFIITIVVLGSCLKVLNKVLNKITKGVL